MAQIGIGDNAEEICLSIPDMPAELLEAFNIPTIEELRNRVAESILKLKKDCGEGI